MSEFAPFRDMVDACFPGSKNTVKQTFADRPDIIVRSNSDSFKTTFEQAVASRAEYEILRDSYGIFIPKMSLVFGDNLYTVIQKVHGSNLEDAFKSSTPVLIDEFQRNCIGLTKYYLDRLAPNTRYLAEITSLNNYVYGTIESGLEPHIYLVDIEHHILAGIEEQDGYDNWMVWFSLIVDNLIKAEYIGRIKFSGARNFIMNAVLSDPPTSKLNPKVSTYLKKCLRRNRLVDYDHLLEEMF